MASTDGASGGELPEIAAERAVEDTACGVMLVDVREQDEWDAAHAPTAVFLPMSELTTRATELPRDRQLNIICHSGMRSLRATSYLRSLGFDAVNVSDGMVGWMAAGGALTANTANTPGADA